MTRRIGGLIRLRPERAEEYLALHRDVWPEVRAAIGRAHLVDYTIYLRDGLLFSTYAYTGDDYEADMARLAEDPATRRWWALCMPCQEPLAGRLEGEWWAPMEEVFHQD